MSSTKGHHGILRIGRLARWHRRCTHGVLGACALTGLVWWALTDAWSLGPPQTVPWWLAHGITGLLSLMAIGAALPQHVVAAWRHHRNRVAGTLALALLAAVASSALLLLYGPESWHAATHWVHAGIGVVALVVFPWHVLKGRRSLARTAVHPPQS